MRLLTVKQVAALNKPGTWWVSRNLYVQVGDTRTKAWLFRYMLNGRAHGMGLGSLELVTLAEARDKALLCRKLLLDGVDPLEARRQKRMQALLTAAATITFRDCAKRYIEAYGKGWKNGKHRQQWRNTLETYAYPVIGELPVAAIDTALIMQVIEPIWTTKTETASRLRGRIEAILDWATARNYRTGENPARWRGHSTSCCRSARRWLRSTTTTPRRTPSCRHSWRSCAAGRYGGAVPGVHDPDRGPHRRGDRRAVAEIDLEARAWTVPAERMKGGKEHTVPLSDRALEILAAVPRSGDYVFENGRSRHPLSNTAMIMTLRRMGPATSRCTASARPSATGRPSRPTTRTTWSRWRSRIPSGTRSRRPIAEAICSQSAAS